MSRRSWLWVGFVAVHLIVATLGFVQPNAPMGDVYLVYEPWVRAAVDHGVVPGIAGDWIYPQLAIVPMVLALGLEWAGGYVIGWALLVIALDALAFAVLIGRGRSAGRTAAAVFWLGFILLLGPVGMYRLDAVTVPLAITGLLWLARRPLLAAILLSVATWVKVWPAALLAAAVIAVRRRLAVIGGAVIVSALTLVAVFAAGGAAHAFGFVGEQAGRGLQLEAPVTAWYLWQAVAGVEGAFVYYDSEILTFQVAGANVDAVIAAMTPLLAIAVLAVALLGALKAWRGASFAVLFPPLSLALVLALIVFNKVGSPQFLTWIIAPLVFGLVLDRRRWVGPSAIALAAALLTQLVYPLTYDRLILADPLAAGILTARNLLFIALFAWAVVRLIRVRGRLRAVARVS